jgi:hypothetical protein
MNNMPFSQRWKGTLTYMKAPNITAVHAFTTRHGGVSTGIYDSLNLGENRGDEPENVRRNYEIIAEELGFDYHDIVFTKQVHQANVRVVTADDRHELFTQVPYEVDGIITDVRKVPLIVFTADCVPILMQDTKKGVIAAVHAGWRGTVKNIAARAVNIMRDEFGCRGEDIQAAIGPCISVCCFETGPEVPQAMKEIAGNDAEQFFFMLESGKFMVDLKGFNEYLLVKAGLRDRNISVSDECTMCSSDKYWSHRQTHGQRGSQASIIMLP